ncbi:MAG: prepilin-type N-terminal cleavage/methylation domain-containing protein [Candidatus Gastranaerophilales bacterium]|nr:prepilin-type N-terminal cleavage/methylation domain-containing protein [Candidatus Gastranaerophilales bacterium]
MLRLERNKLYKKAFTLAETLIALAIIGVVAVIVLSQVMTSVNEMSWAKAKDNFEAKLDEATKQMNVNGDLPSGTGLETETFVNNFQKYIKIAQRCTQPNLTDCFVSTFKLSDGTEVATSSLTTGEDFGHSTYTQPLMGLSLADGTNMLLAFNPSCTYLDWVENQGSIYSGSTTSKSYFPGATISCLATIYDINGNKPPNTVGKDIGELNAVLDGDDCIRFGGMCIGLSNLSYSPISEAPYSNNDNYWAGARETCENIGWRMPTDPEMTIIRNTSNINLGIKNLLNMPSGLYWTSTPNPTSTPFVWIINFPTGRHDAWGVKNYSLGGGFKLRCVK